MINFKCQKLILTALMTLCIILNGCIHPAWQTIGSYEKDVSHKKTLWGGYIQNQEYRLAQDVFILQINGDPAPEYALVPPRILVPGKCDLYYTAPESFEMYKLAPSRWPSILCILEKGTRVRCKKIIQTGALLWGSSITVYAEIVDEMYTDFLVDIHDISITCEEAKGVYLHYPNPKILKYVD